MKAKKSPRPIAAAIAAPVDAPTAVADGTVAVDPADAAGAVRFDDDSMWVDLDDGRRIAVPLAWFPRLLAATPEQRAQFDHVLREIFGGAHQVLAQRLADPHVCPRSAPQPQIDPPRRKFGEQGKSLRNFERRIMRQHDPARSDADAAGGIA